MAASNGKITLEFSHERSTKNTERYEEVSANGQPPVIRTLYLQRWALGETVPSKVKVELTPA